jgi:hypothetical protein
MVLPLDVIQVILSYNNSQAVLDRSTLQYVFRILSYDCFRSIGDMYSKVKLYGNSNFTRMHTTYNVPFDIKWYEISCSDKWTVRHVTKRYLPYFDEEVCTGHQYRYYGKIVYLVLPS